MHDLALADDELAAIETRFQLALTERSFGDLPVLGYGELGVALGYPAEQPRIVVKRLAPHPDPGEVARHSQRIRDYEDLLRPHITVTESVHQTTANAVGWLAPYVIQPLYAKATLGDQVLAASEPDAEHPFLMALHDAVVSTANAVRTVLDSQVSNMVWDENGLLVFDTGSPFFFDEAGDPIIELGAYASSIPAPFHPIARKLSDKITRDLGTRSGNLAHCALSIVRVGEERWLDATLASFNQCLDEPISRGDVIAQFDRLHTDMQNMKRLSRVQRAWTEKVRRRTYEFFITDSFEGRLV